MAFAVLSPFISFFRPIRQSLYQNSLPIELVAKRKARCTPSPNAKPFSRKCSAPPQAQQKTPFGNILDFVLYYMYSRKNQKILFCKIFLIKNKKPKLKHMRFHLGFSYYFSIFFSIVTQDAVSILRILPHKLRSSLKTSSPKKKSQRQLCMVSAIAVWNQILHVIKPKWIITYIATQ